MRCSVAAIPPRQLAAATDGTPDGGSFAGSISTNGIRRSPSQECWAGASSTRWNSTPELTRAYSFSGQPYSSRPSRLRVAAAETTTSSPASCAASAAPYSTAPDQALSSECTTRSTIAVGLGASQRGLRMYPRRSRTSVTRRRVSGATSSRPLTTFDAVGTDTPASRATTASVGPVDPAERAIETPFPNGPRGTPDRAAIGDQP